MFREMRNHELDRERVPDLPSKRNPCLREIL
jgi:hypothetical protein